MPTGHYQRKPLSEETKRKISESKKGIPPHPNTIAAVREMLKRPERKIISLAALRKAHLNNIGKSFSYERKQKMSEAAKRRYQNPEERLKLSAKQRGSKSHNWKGGKTKASKKLRNSIHFKLWREAVFERDNYICQECGKKSGMLHPHHIKSFAEFPELRFAIDNGKTLCVNCHQELHGLTKLSLIKGGN